MEFVMFAAAAAALAAGFHYWGAACNKAYATAHVPHTDHFFAEKAAAMAANGDYV